MDGVIFVVCVIGKHDFNFRQFRYFLEWQDIESGDVFFALHEDRLEYYVFCEHKLDIHQYEELISTPNFRHIKGYRCGD